jgi:hypothetical protein
MQKERGLQLYQKATIALDAAWPGCKNRGEVSFKKSPNPLKINEIVWNL